MFFEKKETLKIEEKITIDRISKRPTMNQKLTADEVAPAIEEPKTVEKMLIDIEPIAKH